MTTDPLAGAIADALRDVRLRLGFNARACAWYEGFIALSGTERDDIAAAVLPVVTAALAGAPAWNCPNCGAETRARMADHQPSAGRAGDDTGGAEHG